MSRSATGCGALCPSSAGGRGPCPPPPHATAAPARRGAEAYPRGRRGDELPLEGSVISVADTYDAMTSDRPYRRGMAWEQGRAELLRCRGAPPPRPAGDPVVARL